MNVLVFCAHADDEVIGIGGTLRKLANDGATIRLVMFSEGAEGYVELEQKPIVVKTRSEETARVCEILGIKEYFNLGQLDWNLRVDNAAYHEVVRHIRQFKPDMVITHSRADYNDHIAVHDVTTEGWFHAAIPCAMEDGPIWKHVPVYEFEVLQPMSNPSLIVDISDTYDAKVQAMEVYVSQHDVVGGVFQLLEGRSLERGFLIGVKYGEALRRSHYRPRAVSDAKALLEM